MTYVQVTGGAGSRQVNHTVANFVSNQSQDTNKGWFYNIFRNVTPFRASDSADYRERDMNTRVS
jgi:hypothetical protein